MSWPNGKVPYVFNSDVSNERRQVFFECVRAWQQFGNIRFVPTTEDGFHQSPAGYYLLVQRNDIKFLNWVEDVNYAWIGRSGNIGFPVAGMQPMSIHNWTHDIVAHEMGHTLGFIHEQMRNDRDNYVRLNWDQINGFTAINFDKEPNATYRTDYDYHSIMHYHSTAFRDTWKTGLTIEATADPSATAVIGTKQGSPENAHEWDEGWLGRITVMMSNGDRMAIGAEYGKPTHVKGVVKLPNGKLMSGVTVRLVAQGTGEDEQSFVDLLHETNEHEIVTDHTGEFAFRGIPTGHFRVQLTRPRFTFSGTTTFWGGTAEDLTLNITATNTETEPPDARIVTPKTGSFQKELTISGTARDTGGSGLKDVQVTVSSGTCWWNWDTEEFGPPGEVFAEGPHALEINTFTGTDGDQWTVPAAALVQLKAKLVDGVVGLNVRGRDFSNNADPWEGMSFTLDRGLPSMALPAVTTDGAPFFDFERLPVGAQKVALGGTATDASDNQLEVTFRIRESNGLNPAKYWTGTGWTSDANNAATNLAAKVANGRWEPLNIDALPQRKDLSQTTYTVLATIKDRAGNAQAAIPIRVTRTGVDTTFPEVTIDSFTDGARYAEHAMPALNGAASDEESGVQGVRLYFMRYAPDLAAANQEHPFRYWTGKEWSVTPGHLEVDYNKVFQRWTAPAMDYRLPTGAEELPDGTYKVQATAFNRENPQATLLMEKTFFIATAPPQVSIATPSHNGYVKQGWSLSGTVTDPSGTGFDNLNRIALTLSSDQGFWNGQAWQPQPYALEVPILPGNTWTYPGTMAGHSLPPGETQYAASASVGDNNGNISVPVAGGLPGNNQILFRVDTTPPTCVIASPTSGTVVTQPPLLPSIFHGTATDSSGQPQMSLFLKRLSDGYYWTGSTWSWTADEAIMPGVYAGGTGSQAWALQKNFPCLTRYFWGMPNGNYELIAIAKDAAGNQTQRSADLVINHNPVWLGAQDLLARALPNQTTPIAGGTVGSTQVQTITPWQEGQPGNGGHLHPVSFTADSQGRYFVTNRVAEPTLVGGSYRYLYHGIIQRLGAGGWRRQRTTFQVVNADFSTSYFERWSPDGTVIQLSNFEAGISYADPVKAKTDAAGNTYVAFDLARYTSYPTARYYNAGHVMVVKFDAAGSLVWRQILPEMGLVRPEEWLTYSMVSSLEVHADGAVSVVIDNRTDYQSNFRQNTVVARISATGVTQGHVRVGNQVAPYELSAPLYSAVDGSGNTYVITRDSVDGAGYARQVLRKINSGNTVVATLETSLCDAPQYWEALATDAAGNVYVLGTFDLGNEDARCCVTRYDSSLNQVWRSFGPPKSVYLDPNYNMGGQSSGLDYRFHVGSHGITVAHQTPASMESELRDAHPLVSRFSLSGSLLWSRGYGNADDSVYQADGLSTLDVTPAGDVLFFGWLALGSYTVQPVYGKISHAGDLQFFMNQTDPWSVNLTTLLPDNRLAAMHFWAGGEYSANSEQRVLVYDNPASVEIAVTLDAALPGNRTVSVGQSVELRVVNRGSAATYQWRKENAQGLPQNIPGATGDALSLQNLQLADAGNYSCLVTNSLGSVASRTAVLTVLQPVALAVALDTPGRTWTTGGDLPWEGFASPSPNRDGVDAAASGSIGDNQASWVETVVEGPAEVTFWWKISAEYQYDTLSFTVNGTQVGDSISWEQDWAKVTHTVEAGQHTMRWAFQRDSSGGSGANKAWLDSFSVAVPPATVPLAEALDTPLTFTTGGNAAWKGQAPTPSHDGVDAAVSGDITHYGESWMETSVTGPGTVSFWWKVSSEYSYDYLEFHRDGTLQTGRISGSVDWQKKTYTVPAGTHTLRWRYIKDEIVDSGLDTAWVDEVVWTPDAATFSSWQSSKFTSEQLADPLISGPMADPNHDGIPNVLAYALGLDPLLTGIKVTDAATSGMSGTTTADHLVLTLALPDPLPGGVTYTIEATNKTSLGSGTWTPIATRTSASSWSGTGAVTEEGVVNGRRTVRVHDTVNRGASDGRFMRLKVSSQ